MMVEMDEGEAEERAKMVVLLRSAIWELMEIEVDDMGIAIDGDQAMGKVTIALQMIARALEVIDPIEIVDSLEEEEEA